MSVAFRAEHLHKWFGSLQVTNDVSIELPRGQRHGLIGPNGAGKTTLFNLLTGEVKADRGRIVLEDRDISGASPDARARAGLARSFQRNNLFADLTVRENLAIACALRDGIGHVFWRRFSRFPHIRWATESKAELLGLTEELDTPVRHLSYGTQRQLEIGLALTLEPRVLLLDEPTSGMSPGRDRGNAGVDRRPARGADGAGHRARHGRDLRDRGPHHRARLRTGAAGRHAGGGARFRRGPAPLSRSRFVSEPPLLALEGVEAFYDQSHVLQSVSLEVRAGTVVGLLGRNGAGKSTTLKAIMGIVPARDGRIHFDEVEISHAPTYRVAGLGIGYVPEDRGIFPFSVGR